MHQDAGCRASCTDPARGSISSCFHSTRRHGLICSSFLYLSSNRREVLGARHRLCVRSKALCVSNHRRESASTSVEGLACKKTGAGTGGCPPAARTCVPARLGTPAAVGRAPLPGPPRRGRGRAGAQPHRERTGPPAKGPSRGRWASAASRAAAAQSSEVGRARTGRSAQIRVPATHDLHVNIPGRDSTSDGFELGRFARAGPPFRIYVSVPSRMLVAREPRPGPRCQGHRGRANTNREERPSALRVSCRSESKRPRVRPCTPRSSRFFGRIATTEPCRRRVATQACPRSIPWGCPSPSRLAETTKRCRRLTVQMGRSWRIPWHRQPSTMSRHHRQHTFHHRRHTAATSRRHRPDTAVQDPVRPSGTVDNDGGESAGHWSRDTPSQWLTMPARPQLPRSRNSRAKTRDGDGRVANRSGIGRVVPGNKTDGGCVSRRMLETQQKMRTLENPQHTQPRTSALFFFVGWGGAFSGQRSLAARERLHQV